MNWIYPSENKKEDESVLEFLLRSRGIDSIENFLDISTDRLRTWEGLHDVVRAAEHIIQAAKSGKKIFIHGDFDADGVCATSLLWNFLYRELKADVTPYIPSRFTEGYGLSESSIQGMRDQGAQLIITVDCGVKDIDLVRKYTEMGMEFIITDHHTLPVDEQGDEIVSEEAIAVVHPRHPKQKYPFTEISGAAVAWKLASAINSLAKLNADIYSYLDLVAISTVCDVMPLIDENRIFVARGLNLLNVSPSPGITSLKKLASINSIETYHLGFVLGPRINAAGRLGDALEAVRLLTTTSSHHADSYAQKLQTLNFQRQQKTTELMEEVEAQILENPNEILYFIYGEGWHEGVVGLVAGKLTEKYHRPILVGSLTEEGVIKASARSISGFHVANALNHNAKLLERFGGHELAAGFSIKPENIVAFTDAMKALAKEVLDESKLEKNLKIDMVMQPQNLTKDVVKQILSMEPFGFGNPTPVVVLENLKIAYLDYFGKDKQYLKIKLEGLDNLEIVAFSDVDKYKKLIIGDTISVAGNLQLNVWNGNEKLQMRIIDYKY